MRHSRRCGPRYGGPAHFDPREDWPMHGRRGDLPPRRSPASAPRGRRARRGAVKAAVLVLLAEEPRNGYALIQEIEARSEGAWRPSPGSIYPALAMMEDEGLIKSVERRRPAQVRTHRLGPRDRWPRAARTPRLRGSRPAATFGRRRRGARASTIRQVGMAVRRRSPRWAPKSSSSRPSRYWPKPGAPSTGSWPRTRTPSAVTPLAPGRAGSVAVP